MTTTRKPAVDTAESAGEPAVRCPVCGFAYTHAESRVEIYDNRPPERRWSFRIPMLCENSHKFDLEIEQYKGMTFVWAHSTDTPTSPRTA